MHRSELETMNGSMPMSTKRVIVLAASLLLVFAALGLRLGFLPVLLPHAAFTVSYAYVVVRARLAAFHPSL
mgnify:CR=1 FL=1